tara:strand:- start:19543 stop:19803 length:261 start_codon:yes stop_codon:yes gene_type:complete
MVTFANQAVPVAKAIIEDIQARLKVKEQTKPLFACGERVTVTEGPLRELDAIFSSLDGEERAIILLSIMHRQQEVKVPLKALRSFA